ncbi:LLM class F420-dependent oxidoreductase [Fodinicola acaciae]|uniref:LLM class F420-dependent oxidoreductase n=1 Tax=Fodinicola acaciae TaxID=2681555 RepID=UPI0013D1E5DA|nr:LLM class F420-dependent oxidoreductase [Fodinicola acaciae]
MKLGLHLPNFSYPNGPAKLGSDLATIAKAAEDIGFDRVSVMDHLFQIPVVGPVENEMLEAYTALGFIAAHTSRVKLYTLVTAATYRQPGVLAKAVTTLDVLSNGRAMLGVGAGWNEEEVAGLGLPFGPTAERFERLEETLQVCLQMWSDSDAAYDGKHYQLGRTLNSPQALSKPHPPILIGGGGEKKTLRLVAKYAQACNIFGGPDVEHKLNVLREHCEREGTDYDAIEKTCMVNFRADRDEVKAQLEQLHGLGIDVATGWTRDDPAGLEAFGRDVVPFADGLT